MKPLGKNQTLLERAKKAGLALVERAGEAARTNGADAAWEVVYNAICDEGEYVQEVSPEALVTYQMYVSLAFGFLQERPDYKKALQVIKRIDMDLSIFCERFITMKYSHFTEDECVMIAATMSVLKKTIQSLDIR